MCVRRRAFGALVAAAPTLSRARMHFSLTLAISRLAARFFGTALASCVVWRESVCVCVCVCVCMCVLAGGGK